MTPAEIAIQALMAPLAGVVTIWAQQSAPRPPKPYVTLHTVSSIGPEHEHYLHVGTDGNQSVESHRDLMIEIQAFGDDAFGLLEALRQKLHWQTTLDAAFLAGLAIFERGAVQNISLLLDEAFWEPRAMFEVGVRSIRKSLDAVGVIETVIQTGTVAVPGTPELTETFSIVFP